METEQLQEPSFQGKITLSVNFGNELRKLGMISVYDLIDMAEEALVSLKIKVWVTFDRLDVAFSENPQLEALAIKTLFYVYNDMKDYSQIGMKIFIRDDIWKRITSDGFREGSHITKQVTIRWTEQDLLHLLVSRILDNEEIINVFGLEKSRILGDIELQRNLFYKIFPEKVDTGKEP